MGAVDTPDIEFERFCTENTSRSPICKLYIMYKRRLETSHLWNEVNELKILESWRDDGLIFLDITDNEIIVENRYAKSAKNPFADGIIDTITFVFGGNARSLVFKFK